MSINIGSQPAKLYLGDVLLTGSSGWVSDESMLLNITNDIGVVGLNLTWANLSTPFTIEVCKEIDATYSRSDGTLFFVRAPSNYYGFKIDGTTDNQIIIANGTGYTKTYTQTSEYFPSGAMHTISCVFTDEANYLYFDGELLGSYAIGATTNGPIKALYFNCDANTAHTVKGTAYAYRIYNRALTAAEIKQNYTQDIAAFGGDV